MPGIHFSIKVVGEEQVRAGLGSMSEILDSEQRAAMHRSVLAVAEEAARLVHSPEGRARRGIRGKVTVLFGQAVRGVIEPHNAAAIFSQRTRRPDQRMPPPNKIRAWLRRRGEPHTPAVAFLVARAIGRKGTTGHPVMARSLEARQRQVLANFREALRKSIQRAMAKALKP